MRKAGANALAGALHFAVLLLTATVGLAAGPGLSARSVDVAEDGGRTRFGLILSHGVPVEVFSLANPYRVVIDLPEVQFDLPAEAGRRGKGLVTAYRFGLFAADKSRMVLDTGGPVLIEEARMVALPDGSVRLELAFVGTDPATFGGGTGASRQAPRPQRDQPREKSTGSRPVIVVDPGHGGIDPGTLGQGATYEKDIVLAVGLKLTAALAETGRYEVHLTRDSDVFVSLDDRLALSAERGADLFISLHADALADSNFARHVRGATVYTLSERASDELARRMAEKENSADLVAGLSVATGEAADDVRDILIDLMKRETANFSSDFSTALVSRMKEAVKLSRDPRRSAAFKVLKQTNTPSVLLELGYLSNPEDERTMLTTKWQRDMASSIARAVEDYFARRLAGAR
ncbi:MAG: N-acetylmuramoyl-L-alanine amidase [Hyphomicrobiaceae bacterium]|nr:N-acetylmuramoyl-L-alanine amidase [Hyphomicrobiaceae bacterium]